MFFELRTLDAMHKNLKPFLQAAIMAFPPDVHSLANDAARRLTPFVDDAYRRKPIRAIVQGRPVLIPTRIHFLNLEPTERQLQGNSWLAIQALCTRSTDGFIRQASLRQILGASEPWAAPFVVLLAGEYVVEIIEDIVASLPTLSSEIYAEFVRENRPLMRQLRSKATSYWNHFYRSSYPNKGAYPGIAFLQQLERWAS